MSWAVVAQHEAAAEQLARRLEQELPQRLADIERQLEEKRRERDALRQATEGKVREACALAAWPLLCLPAALLTAPARAGSHVKH